MVAGTWEEVLVLLTNTVDLFQPLLRRLLVGDFNQGDNVWLVYVWDWSCYEIRARFVRYGD